MAQETGTQILARARIKANDNDANSNFAVGAASALILLNDVLVEMNNNSKTKTKTIAAGTTGLTWSSGDVSKLCFSVDITEFESFHPTSSTSISYPLSPALQRISVQEMMDLLGFDGDHTLGAQATEWSYVAAEKTQDDTAASGVEKWRVYGWPVINRTRSMTVKAVIPVTISAIGDYPDLDVVDSRIASSLLAYKMAKLKKETSRAFLDGILEDVPPAMRPMNYGNAVRQSQLQDFVIGTRD